MSKETESTAPYIGVGVAILGVSFAAILVRWSDSPPLTIAVYRFIFFSLILLPLVMATSREEIRRLDRRDMGIMALIGLMLAMHFFLFISSIKMTSVSNAVLLATSHPVIVGVLAFLLLRESNRAVALGIVAGMMGMVIIALGDMGGGNFPGDMVALASSIPFAGYILLGKVSRRKISLIPYVFLIFTTCALFLLAGALVFQQPLLPVPMEEVLIFLGLAVISTMFGHTLFSWSLRYFTASFVSLAYLGEPIGATILAALLLAELPTVNWMIGGVLVLIGIVLTARTEIAARNGRRQGR